MNCECLSFSLPRNLIIHLYLNVFFRNFAKTRKINVAPATEDEDELFKNLAIFQSLSEQRCTMKKKDQGSKKQY